VTKTVLAMKLPVGTLTNRLHE